MKLPKAESPIEATLARDLRALKAPEFTRQYRPFPDARIALDFAWPQLGLLAVEVQGEVHRIHARFHGDIARRRRLLMAGWRVLEVDGQRVRSGEAVQWVIEFLRTFG